MVANGRKGGQSDWRDQMQMTCKKHIGWKKKKIQQIYTKCQRAAMHFARCQPYQGHINAPVNKSKYAERYNKAGEATQRGHLGKVAYEDCYNRRVWGKMLRAWKVFSKRLCSNTLG